MGRGNRNLDSTQYDTYLTSRAKDSRSARAELAQRHSERRNAHDSDGRGWHFGIGDSPVRVESKDHLRHELNARGLMLHEDVKKDLK